jgi:DNA-binding transcriptional LysR family regulator
MPRPLRFKPRQLEGFIAIAELGSFRAAGERLHLTPSAVSQLISDLEKALGFKLLDRTTRKVKVSSGGLEFIGPARTALHHLTLAASAAADVRDRAAGVVRVAAPLVLAGSALPGAIADYRQLRPKVRVKIRDTSVEQLVDVVASADVDFSIGPDRIVGDNVERTILFDTPWVMWCSPDHYLASQPTVSWPHLRDIPIVAAGRDHERNVARMRASLPESERITPVEVVENTTTALGIAAEGMAVTLAPAYVGVLASRMGLVMRRVVKHEVVRQVCLYTPLNRTSSPAAEGFREHLASWVVEWNKQTTRGIIRRPESLSPDS